MSFGTQLAFYFTDVVIRNGLFHWQLVKSLLRVATARYWMAMRRSVPQCCAVTEANGREALTVTGLQAKQLM
jgi:hypothetical protein